MSIVFSEFWNNYIVGESNVLDAYDSLMEIFSKEISPDILEEYYVVDVLFEVLYKCEEEKDFTKLIEFSLLVSKTNPDIYKEVSSAYLRRKVDYFCFHRKKEELDLLKTELIASALHDYDFYLMSIRLLLLYGHSELINEVITANHEEVSNSSDILGDYYQSLYKSQYELQKLYENKSLIEEQNLSAFINQLSVYGFDIDEEKYSKVLYSGFILDANTLKDEIIDDFELSRGISLEKLEKRFMVYMLNYNANFLISSHIFNFLYEYWESEERETITAYFVLEKAKYFAFLRNKAGMILDYRFFSTSILWGSSYIYDFLLELDLISLEVYESAKEIISEFKGLLIKENLPNLWRFDFVHEWSCPSMELQENFEKEKILFRTHHNTKREDIKELIEPGFFTMPREDELLNSLGKSAPSNKPVKKEPKIGRNEKISVEYTDGTIKKNVKYKKVMKDIASGQCKIINVS